MQQENPHQTGPGHHLGAGSRGRSRTRFPRGRLVPLLVPPASAIGAPARALLCRSSRGRSRVCRRSLAVPGHVPLVTAIAVPQVPPCPAQPFGT